MHLQDLGKQLLSEINTIATSKKDEERMSARSSNALDAVLSSSEKGRLRPSVVGKGPVASVRKQ